MSFVVWAALAIAFLVAVPIAAHLLRQGRAVEREFPPVHLVPSAPPVARQRSRLEDRALLAIRALLLVGLAMLGAIPLVRCSHLSLARNGGASVALAIVIDDSLSMRARTASGRTRWERSVDGAENLVRSAREGDAVAIVLAGRPARLALAATTDLEVARRTLRSLHVSDRATDLANAVQLGRSALMQLPQVDKRVAVLSDLAAQDIPEGNPPPWIPLDELREPTSNCAVVQANSRGRRVTVEAACSSAMAARGRRVEIVAAIDETTATASATPTSKGVLGSAELTTHAGIQTLTIELEAPPVELEARLTERDAIDEDNLAPVATEAAAPVVAVVSDVATSSVTTGGATLTEQALRALESGVQVRPLTLLPDEPQDLEPYAAVVLDDPVGLSPEARHAIQRWLEHGGVAVAFVGPAVESAQLGASLDPFAKASISWEKTDADGMDPATAPWLGAEAASLAHLAPRGRASLDTAIPGGARVIARWTDARPFVLEHPLERGVAFTVGLPSSAAQSDLALRPGFLALLKRIVTEAARRRGPRVTVVGTPWTFPGRVPVTIADPNGNETELDVDTEPRSFVPAERGRYRVRIGDDVQVRVVTIDAKEVTLRPRNPASVAHSVLQGGVSTQVDVSRQLAWIVLLLFGTEGLFRWATRRRRAAVG